MAHGLLVIRFEALLASESLGTCCRIDETQELRHHARDTALFENASFAYVSIYAVHEGRTSDRAVSLVAFDAFAIAEASPKRVQRLVDRVKVLARLASVDELLGGDPLEGASVPHDVNQVGGVLVLSSVVERQGLEHQKRDHVCKAYRLGGLAAAVEEFGGDLPLGKPPVHDACVLDREGRDVFAIYSGHLAAGQFLARVSQELDENVLVLGHLPLPAPPSVMRKTQGR